MSHLLRIISILSIFIVSLQANSFENIKTFKANFKQTITNPSGKDAIYKGQIHIKEPTFIKWHYEEPITKFVYVKKYTVTIIEPDLEQVIVTKLNKEINILTLLKNAKKITPTQYLSNFNNTDYIITLKDNTLSTITYKDELENNVSISFTNVKQNISIDDTVFKFFIPLEYDVIKK
jgi:outer membrane lipoprotein carrier protein